MAVDAIRKQTGTTFPPLANSGTAAGLVYNNSDGLLYYDDDGTARALMNTSEDLTLTGSYTFDGVITFTGGLAGADSDGLLFGGGDSSTPVALGASAANAIEFRTASTHTSGDVRLAYLRHYFQGAAGAGETLRVFSTVDGVAASTIRGAHISLNWSDSSSKVTGLGVALECTLHISNAAAVTGTIAPLKVAINADGASSDPANATLSYIQFANQGNTTGDDNTDDDASLFHLSGFAISSGHTFAAQAAAAVSHVLKINVDGTPYYIMVSNAA